MAWPLLFLASTAYASVGLSHLLAAPVAPVDQQLQLSKDQPGLLLNHGEGEGAPM